MWRHDEARTLAPGSSGFRRDLGWGDYRWKIRWILGMAKANYNRPLLTADLTCRSGLRANFSAE